MVELSVKSLMSFDGVRWMLLSAVDNFIEFAPLGPVLTVMIGIGVAGAPASSRWASGPRDSGSGCAAHRRWSSRAS